MAGRAALITNNPLFPDRAPSRVDVCLLSGDACSVLVAARDRIHKGWRLANHPLYGNFRPYQQPYRSMVLLPPNGNGTDPESLHFLEEALQLYQGPVRKIRPDCVPQAMRDDCAMLDSELIKATLESVD